MGLDAEDEESTLQAAARKAVTTSKPRNLAL
jgi:hypothetical protein